MNKVLVRVFIPVIDKEYEMWLPINKKIYKIIKLLIKSINELCGGYYNPLKMPMLYDKSTGRAYDLNMNLKEAKVKNGTELILI